MGVGGSAGVDGLLLLLVISLLVMLLLLIVGADADDCSWLILRSSMLSPPRGMVRLLLSEPGPTPLTLTFTGGGINNACGCRKRGYYRVRERVLSSEREGVLSSEREGVLSRERVCYRERGCVIERERVSYRERGCVIERESVLLVCYE